MRIVQIAPFIGPGSGVAGVAWNLEREWRTLGADVESFTYANTRRAPILPVSPARPLGRRVLRAWRVVWFSIAGTIDAKNYLAERPDAVSICHSEALAGDIFVSHGVESIAIRARRRGWWHLLVNPVRLFTYRRERRRYRSPVHDTIVVLSDAEAAALDRTFGPIVPRVEVIPNGVDLERFRPPTAEERAAMRGEFRLEPDSCVALLIGHDLLRKGALTAVDALAYAPSVLLLIVGGDAESITSTMARAKETGVEGRVHFAGVRDDIPSLMWASDLFLLPSAYEANALVVLEALACGLPVVCTPVGYAPEIVVEGVNGWLVSPEAAAIGARLEEAAAVDLTGMRDRARSSVAHLSWTAVAERYLALAADVAARRGERSSTR